MKKVIYFATAAVLSLTMVSCGGTNESDEDKIEKELLKEFEEKQEAELDNIEAGLKENGAEIMENAQEMGEDMMDKGAEMVEEGKDIVEESQEKGQEMIKDIKM
ncbi:MAG: hypothetical protein ACPGU5_00250 [Lishizhenia sp.]